MQKTCLMNRWICSFTEWIRFPVTMYVLPFVISIMFIAWWFRKRINELACITLTKSYFGWKLMNWFIDTMFFKYICVATFLVQCVYDLTCTPMLNMSASPADHSAIISKLCVGQTKSTSAVIIIVINRKKNINQKSDNRFKRITYKDYLFSN